MHIAIDLGGKKSQVCIRNADGEILKERKVPTRELKAFMAEIPTPARVVMETCAEAFAIARQLKEIGHTPVVVPATLAPALGVGARGLKSDQRDGRTLSEASVRMKTLPSVHIPSLYAQQLKQESTSRDLLVKTRTQTVNHIKGWFRVHLKERPSGGPEVLPKRVREAWKEVPEHLESVLKILDALNQEIAKADKRLAGLAKKDDICQRLQTIPGVGPVTAVRFRGAVDDVKRFESANAIESYFGLTPGENSSSERVSKTRITKAGASEMRRLLLQCAHVAMNSCRNEPMSQWALELARKKNKPIAVTALARKICGIMYALWKKNSTYNPTLSAQPRAPLSKEEIAAINGKIWTEKEPRTH